MRIIARRVQADLAVMAGEGSAVPDIGACVLSKIASPQGAMSCGRNEERLNIDMYSRSPSEVPRRMERRFHLLVGRGGPKLDTDPMDGM